MSGLAADGTRIDRERVIALADMAAINQLREMRELSKGQ